MRMGRCGHGRGSRVQNRVGETGQGFVRLNSIGRRAIKLCSGTALMEGIKSQASVREQYRTMNRFSRVRSIGVHVGRKASLDGMIPSDGLGPEDHYYGSDVDTLIVHSISQEF